MNEKTFCEKGHVWPRRGFDSRLSSGMCRREIWTCNNCIATKVVIETDHWDGKTLSTTRTEQVVEPPK